MSAGSYADQKAVARANRGFYRAFEALDLEAMRAVWSRADDVQCVHPGGELLVGPARVFGAWEAIFANTEAIRFELSDPAIAVAGEAAWVTLLERIESSPRAGPVGATAAATNVFRREGGEWRLVHHHASPVARRFFHEPP